MLDTQLPRLYLWTTEYLFKNEDFKVPHLQKSILWMSAYDAILTLLE